MSETSSNPKKSSPKLASGATAAPSSRFSWRDHFASERRWLADTFARDRVIDTFKQLAWVVPLTLLIWVYAEREQIETRRNETIPFRLVSTDPNKTVELGPRQDSNVVVELQGPRARVQSILQQLRGGESLQGLRLEVDRNLAAGRHIVPTGSLVTNNPVFTQNGISVSRVQPERLEVLVDDLVEREARVMAPPGVTTLEPATRFEPPNVKVRGPASALDAARVNGVLPVYARVPDDLLRTPGEKESRTLTLELPGNLGSDGRFAVMPPDVRATLHVRASDATWVMPAMTVTLDQPKSVSERYTVEYNTSLPDVTLIGPKDIIESMRNDPNFEPKPYAQLRVTNDDARSDRPARAPRYVDLPPGVRVSEADRTREIQFKLVPRASTE